MRKTPIIRYWIFTVIYLIISYYLINFCTDLLNGWNDPLVISTFEWIKGRLGEIIAFGISVVFIIYMVASIILLIININKFGLKNINYKALARLHSVVMTALIVYIILFSIFFINFNF